MRKNYRYSVSFILFFFYIAGLFAQSGTLKGRVFNRINNQAIPFANVLIDSIQKGATSDINGEYRIESLRPGIYNVICSFVGYKKARFFEVQVSSTKPTRLDIPMDMETEVLAEVQIRSTQFRKSEESPLSLRTIRATEIYRNPGGNRDISKVIQILPGVGTTVSFRNDIIVRGGAPNENRFFLDGIEVPNINHFATQGSSGGPVGMINVNFVREVDFYAGAFPANRGNALSSVMDFKQISGNDEKLTGNFMLGSSDVGLTVDGPMGNNSTFIFSVRRSYLQLLFKALSLPFLPTYNDFQYKQDFRINEKNRITFIGLGAIDDFKLNTGVNDNLDDTEIIDRNNYILGNLPVNNQWNYAIGAKWTHFSKNSYQTMVVSRNQLDNQAIKYQDNIEQSDRLLLDYHSQETETKFRLESLRRQNGWKLNVGAGFQVVEYTNTTYNRKEQNGQVVVIDFASKLPLFKYELFSQLSKSFFGERLSLSAGIRTDFNDYSSTMNNPLSQLSPRFSASWALTPKLRANFNVGRYYQLPAYTVMGYRNADNQLQNKINNIKYIRADHLVAGMEFNPSDYARISLEGFYKIYDRYPFLIADSVSLANLGGDFGVIGNDAVTSTSKGRSYGLELLMQRTLSASVYGILSYTWVRSEFADKQGVYQPSSWDNRHVLNITAGKKLKKNWELGMKFRLLGGAPYTPYNRVLSSLKTVWDVSRTGIYDWNRLNSKRYSVAHGLDVRIDKRWYFKKWAIDLYLDIQNVYNYQVEGPAYLDVLRDVNGLPVEDPDNPLAYQLREIENASGTVLPSIGVMIEF